MPRYWQLLLKAQGDTRNAEQSLRRLKRASRELGQSLNFSAVSTLTQRSIMAVSAASTVGAGASLKLAGSLEQTEVAFERLTGSATVSQKLLKDLQAFALTTPFTFTELTDSSKKLLAYGFTAKEVVPMMTTLGDSVAALGGNEETLSRVARALGQMKQKGKVSAEEMNQLAEAGIGGWSILSQQLGRSVGDLQKEASLGMLTAAEAFPAMVTGLNAKYGGMMKAQSRTFLGQLSNTRDYVEGIGRSVGGTLIEAFDLKNAVKNFNARLALLKKQFEEFAKSGRGKALFAEIRDGAAKAIGVLSSFGSVIMNVGRFLYQHRNIVLAVTAGILAFAAAWRTISIVQNVFKMFKLGFAALAANPIFAIIAGVIALGVAFTVLYKRSETFRNFINSMIPGFQNLGSTAMGALKSIWSGIQPLIPPLKQIGMQFLKFIVDMFKVWQQTAIPIVQMIITTVRQLIPDLKAIGRVIGASLLVYFKYIGVVAPIVFKAIIIVAKLLGAVLKFSVGVALVAIRIGFIIVGGAASAAFNIVRGAWSKATGLFAKVKAGIEKVKTAFNVIKNIVPAIAKAIFEKAKSIGSSIVGGIKQGIKDKYNDLRNYVSGLGDKLVKSLKNAIESRSPSRKFAREIGVPIAEGIALGIRQRIESASKSAEALAERMSNRMASIVRKFDLRKSFLGYKLAEAEFLGKNTQAIIQQQYNLVIARIRALKTFLIRNAKNLRAETKQQIMDELASLFGEAGELRTNITGSGGGAIQSPANTANIIYTSKQKSIKSKQSAKQKTVGNTYNVTVNTDSKVDTVAFMRSLKTASQMGTI